MSGTRFPLIGALLGSTAMLGAMTPVERRHGRYMRGPEGHDDNEFAEFEKSGDVEVGKPAIESNQDEPEPKPKPAAKPAPKPAAAAEKPAAAAAEDGEGDEGDEGDQGDGDEDEGEEGEGEEEGEPKPKPKPKASERIRELNKRLRQEERLRRASDERLTALEKSLLSKGAAGGNSGDDIGEAPDPQDTEKYPLGHLDDRYIEDKLEWLTTKKAAGHADAVLQREQEKEQTARANEARENLLEKVDDLSARGSEQFEDFQETVVEAGMRGDWRLEQSTFEAACDADNGAQILYDLSQDKKEAKRVAELSPYLQLKYVAEKDAEIAKTKQPRKIPRAGEPPATQTRGANSRTRINPATDNLGDFEKAWNEDAKGK